MLTKLEHEPHVVKLLDTIKPDEGGFYVVFEHMAGDIS